nr:putative S-locus glycoprotein domain-containing protein [Tanacetum cinerariifolium]
MKVSKAMKGRMKQQNMPDNWDMVIKRMVELPCNRSIMSILWRVVVVDKQPLPHPEPMLTYTNQNGKMALDSRNHNKKQVVITVTLSISAGLILLALILALYIWSKWKNKSHAERAGRPVLIFDKDNICSREKGDIEVPLFSLSEVSKATNNFSVKNKLGEGGFGPVYKGVLEEGQEIAVKRLSKSSQQGFDEFENEVICIAKLQHRNLVKLLGYCMQGDETLLIYEYMPNKSLDSFIFDESSESPLDWPLRFHIIHGIARGLLYLHQDSRHRIVHRDLKASNILLDHDMNPKISDFGLARMFSEHESEANTKRVVGTLGYISPEYAVNGIFSVKSDIFSFGVLVLEIVSGKKNREDRPNTLSVVSMLGGEGLLPSPKQPGFFIQGGESGSTSIIPSSPSVNAVTLSLMDGR